MCNVLNAVLESTVAITQYTHTHTFLYGDIYVLCDVMFSFIPNHPMTSVWNLRMFSPTRETNRTASYKLNNGKEVRSKWWQ